MTAAALLTRLHENGIVVTVENGSLRLEGHPGAVTPELTTQLRAHKSDLIEALQRPSPLAEFAADLALVIRFHVSETTDVEGDVAFLRRIRLLLDEWPGSNRIRFRIRTLDGRRPLLEWRALATTELRMALARLLAERGLALRTQRGEAA